MNLEKETIRRGLMRCFWKMVTICLLLQSSLWMFKELSTTWVLRTTTINGLLVLLAVYVLLYEVAIPMLKKGAFVVSLGAQLFFFASGMWYFYKHKVIIQQSMLQMYNDIIPHWNKQYGTNLYTIPIQGEVEQLGFEFLVMIIILGSYLFQEIMERRGALLALPGVAFVVSLLINEMLPMKSFVLLLFGMLLLYAGEWSGQRINLKKKGRKSLKELLWQQAPQVAVVVVGAVIVVAVTAIGTPHAKTLTGKMDDVISVQRKVENFVKTFKPMSMQWGLATVTNTAPDYAEQEVMKINSSRYPVGNLYYATYYGAQYANGTWYDDEAEFTKACKNAGYDPIEVITVVNQNCMRRLDEYERIIHFEDSSLERSTYTISYTGISGTTAVNPYFAKEMEPDSLNYNAKGILKKSWFTSSQSYVALAGNESNSTLFQVGIEDEVLQNSREKKIMEWYDAYANAVYTKPLPGIIIQQGEFDRYAMEEEYFLLFSDFLYDESDHNPYRVYIARLLAQGFTSGKYKYSQNLKELEQGADPVNYFMNVSKEGFCMHFASAGVACLREMGIPARFVGGYIAKRNSFQLVGSTYEASVLDSNSHAWVEIYLDGIGWVPIEFTAGYTSPGTQLPTEAHEQEASETQMETETEHESESESQSEAERQTETELPATEDVVKPSGENDSKNSEVSESQQESATPKEAVMIGGGFILTILTILFTIVMARYVLRKQTERLHTAIKEKKNRSAVRMINRSMYRRLVRKGKVRKRNLTDREYIALLQEEYWDVNMEEYLRIVQKASFSREAITDKEVLYVYEISKKAR